MASEQSIEKLRQDINAIQNEWRRKREKWKLMQAKQKWSRKLDNDFEHRSELKNKIDKALFG